MSETTGDIHEDGTRTVNHLIVLGHPSTSSFNAAIAQRYAEIIRENHQQVVVRDLYAIGFDPCLSEDERLPAPDQPPSPEVAVELEHLAAADVVTFIYPLWFGMPPAIIKGYLDRVFGAAFRVDHLAGAGDGRFRRKTLAVISTSAATLPWLDAQGMWVSLRQSFETYLQTVFGFRDSDHYHAPSITDDLREAEADRVLHEVGEFARRIAAQSAMAKRRA